MASVAVRVFVLVASCCYCWKGTQGLDVDIDVLPHDVSIGQNRYPAAAGPVVVICSPFEANGAVTYQWSSTCEACPFKNATDSAIVLPFLTSSVTGHHTCTITDETNDSINATQEFIVVGAGIFVTNAASDSLGYQPNNSMIVATDVETDYRLRFHCVSGSDLYEKGEFIGADGDSITSNKFFSVTNNDKSGSLQVTNSAGDGQDAIISSEQGVYTCRIPDETDEIAIINFGIYPANFSLPPSIDTIKSDVKFQATMLTCISTGSPATTVTWMKDEQPLTIDGTTYQHTQFIIDRKDTTYANVLTVIDQQDNIIGHIYTCSVNNVLGTATLHFNVTKPLPEKHEKTKTGVIVGVVVSLVVTAVIIAAIITVACFYTKKKQRVVTEEALVLKDTKKQTASSYQSINE